MCRDSVSIPLALALSGCGTFVRPEPDSVLPDGSDVVAIQDIAADRGDVPAIRDAGEADALERDSDSTPAAVRIQVINTNPPSDDGDRVFAERLLSWNSTSRSGVNSAPSARGCVVDSEVFPAFEPPAISMTVTAGTDRFDAQRVPDGRLRVRPRSEFLTTTPIELSAIHSSGERWSTAIAPLPFISVNSEPVGGLLVRYTEPIEFEWALPELPASGVVVEIRVTAYLYGAVALQDSYSTIRCEVDPRTLRYSLRLADHPQWRRPARGSGGTILSINVLHRRVVPYFNETAIIESMSESLSRPLSID